VFNAGRDFFAKAIQLVNLSLPRKLSFGFLPLLLVACVVVFCSGCATAPPPAAWSQHQAAALQKALTSLSDRIDVDEAARLAEKAVQEPILLAEQYRAVRPPWVHNILVNRGWRERGLCYHWANDLFGSLHQLSIHSLQFHLVVARMDTRHEHNAVVVTAPGQNFNQGIVLDAWRHSGRIWWGRADTDKYPWKELPYERVNPALQQFVGN
jgi:hypothetical protein